MKHIIQDPLTLARRRPGAEAVGDVLLKDDGMPLVFPSPAHLLLGGSCSLR